MTNMEQMTNDINNNNYAEFNTNKNHEAATA